MRINELLTQLPNVTLNVTGADLKEMVHEAIAETIKNNREIEVQETYLSKSEAAAKLRVSLATLYRWQKQKYLVPVYIGAKPRYKLSEINQLMEKER